MESDYGKKLKKGAEIRERLKCGVEYSILIGSRIWRPSSAYEYHHLTEASSHSRHPHIHLQQHLPPPKSSRTISAFCAATQRAPRRQYSLSREVPLNSRLAVRTTHIQGYPIMFYVPHQTVAPLLQRCKPQAAGRKTNPRRSQLAFQLILISCIRGSAHRLGLKTGTYSLDYNIARIVQSRNSMSGSKLKFHPRRRNKPVPHIQPIVPPILRLVTLPYTSQCLPPSSRTRTI